jgi:hypothetical protein
LQGENKKDVDSPDEPGHDETLGAALRFSQTARRRRRLRLQLCDPRVIFGREIHQAFLGEGVGVFSETAAALCLFS